MKYSKLYKNVKLRSIPKPKKVEDFIGVIDTETYIANDGNIKIYPLGFKTILDKEVVIYYIDRDFG